MSRFLVLFAASAVDDDHDDSLIRQVTDHDEVLLRHHIEQFSLFKWRFNRFYSSPEEHNYRFGVFRDNMRRAKKHQQLDPLAVHGVTPFSDLTPAEFRRTYLGLRHGKVLCGEQATTTAQARKGNQGTSGGKVVAASIVQVVMIYWEKDRDQKERSNRLRLLVDANQAPILPTDDIPDDFDWRDYGAVTAVKNQGSCGSCWSFSTTGALEAAHYLATGELVSLSEQQHMDCHHECDPDEPGSCDSGCNGGLMNSAFEYTLKAGELMREEDYPYTGRDKGTCNYDKSKIAVSVASFSVVTLDESQIAANLVKNGPLAVGINAIFMQTYIGGVSCPLICSQHLDHGVLLVGYGSAGYAPIRLKDKPYWIIKNSWGEDLQG